MKPRVLSILATIVAIAAILRMAFTYRAFGTGPVSIGLQVLAVLLIMWARLTFGRRSFHVAANPTEGELVTRGPYALVRNPIYAAALLFTWTAVCVHLGAETIALGLVITAAMVVRIFFEEQMLRAKYPTYRDYERRVKRLVPYVY